MLSKNELIDELETLMARLESDPDENTDEANGVYKAIEVIKSSTLKKPCAPIATAPEKLHQVFKDFDITIGIDYDIDAFYDRLMNDKIVTTPIEPSKPSVDVDRLVEEVGDEISAKLCVRQSTGVKMSKWIVKQILSATQPNEPSNITEAIEEIDRAKRSISSIKDLYSWEKVVNHLTKIQSLLTNSSKGG